MWANRIIIEELVKHTNAKEKIYSFLKENNLSEEFITDLHISSDSGYMSYKVITSQKTFSVFDDGNVIK